MLEGYFLIRRYIQSHLFSNNIIKAIQTNILHVHTNYTDLYTDILIRTLFLYVCFITPMHSHTQACTRTHPHAHTHAQTHAFLHTVGHLSAKHVVGNICAARNWKAARKTKGKPPSAVEVSFKGFRLEHFDFVVHRFLPSFRCRWTDSPRLAGFRGSRSKTVVVWRRCLLRRNKKSFYLFLSFYWKQQNTFNTQRNVSSQT